MSSNVPNGANKLLGSGAVFFDELTAAGVKTGERYLGNVKAAAVTTTVEVKESYESTTTNRALTNRAITRVTSELSLTMDEFMAKNLALWALGDASTGYSQAGGSVTDELLFGGAAVPSADAWYPVLARKISAVTVKVLAVTKVLNTDYQVDAESGRIYIVPGGTIVPGTDIVKVSYTGAALTGATALDQVLAGTIAKKTGFLRFVGDSTDGPRLEYQFWKVQFIPDGDMPLIMDDYGEFKIKGAILSDGVHSDPYRIIKR